MLTMKENKIKIIVYTFIFHSLILLNISGFAQEDSYGLGFSSHDVVQDRRTSLDLFPDKTFEPRNDFSLSFDLSFFKGKKIYFGYIFRIIKDETENIDFIYDERNSSNKHFRIVIGNNLSSIAFDLDSNTRFNKWTNINLKFDFEHKKIVLLYGKNSYEQRLETLSLSNSFRVFFGANQFQRFKVTDVPPMKLRNIRVKKNEKQERYWPLNEGIGNVAHETEKGFDALTTNPLWLKNDHFGWKHLKTLTVKGNASVAFDATKDRLFAIGSDSLIAIDISGSNNADLITRSELKALIGNESLIVDSKLFNIYPDQQLVSEYNFLGSSWRGTYKSGLTTNFWHFNKTYSAIDTSIYVLNGYGQLQYKNSIFRYHIPTKSWTEIKPSGDFLIPRYLAATGSNNNGDSIFIIGGYGSNSGQQILNPKSLYDLIVYNVKTKQLKKLFELQPGKEDFVFANSMIIDSANHSYYALVYPNYKYNSSLQLLKGSFKDGNYELMGSKIPYEFHDINSFADLYYSPASHLFIAVTLLYNEDHSTTIQLYTLSSPTLNSLEEGLNSNPVRKGIIYWLIAIGSLMIAIITFFLFRKKKLKVEIKQQSVDINPKKPVIQSDVTHNSSTVTENEAEIFTNQGNTNFIETTTSPKTSIYLFGEMQVFDKSRTDITRLFTPLIKELFLIILLFSVRKGRGISSDKLNEILWFDKSPKSARNNRSVNIAKLKTILDSLEFCQISKETGYWKIDIDYNAIYVDFHEYFNLVGNKKKLTRADIEQLSSITQRGPFLANIEHSWLDDFKSEVSNEIIDTYLHYASTLNIADDPESLIKITNYISYFDSVNEDAMIIRCKALYCLGKHSLAKTAYENFLREYHNIYGENFKKDFNTILE